MVQIIINSWLIILGTIFIMVGGLMATYGWNLRSSKEIQASLKQSRIYELKLRREGILKTVSLEVSTNLLILDDKEFTETDKKELSKYVVYPRLRVAALSSVLESALFLEKKHRKFLDGVSQLLAILNTFNNSLELSESAMQKLSPAQIANFRKEIRDGRTIQSTKRELQQFLNVMLTDYRDLLLVWVITEFGDELKKITAEEDVPKKEQD